MHHYCDRCKRAINRRQQTHYEVQIEGQLVSQEPTIQSASEGDDHLLQLHELLGQIEQSGAHPDCPRSIDEAADQVSPPMPKQHFDLCPECYRQFIQNPLGREVSHLFAFSVN